MTVVGIGRSHRVALAIALGFAACAAAAQDNLGVGQSGSSSTNYFGNDVAMNALEGFGRCFASVNPKGAARLIATSPGSAEEAKVYRALFSGESTPCLGDISSLRVPPQYVRGVIAEGLYRRRVPLAPTVQQAVIGQADVRDLSGAARCYVGGHLAESQAVVSTALGSKSERAAVEALMPEFSACLPNGVQARFPYTLIRLRIAEALYRTGAARPAGTEAK